MNRLIFTRATLKEIFNTINKSKERKIFNFLNAYCIYLLRKENFFRESILNRDVLNLLDGSSISLFLSIKNLKRIPRLRGPTFTRDFLSEVKFSGNKRHFFIGLEREDLEKLKNKFPYLKKISSYNPPYIKEIYFPNEEIEKIAKKINKFNSDFVWMGIASPKQNILSYQLFRKTKAKYFFNVGAAMDFILGKKKEAPPWIRKIGIEWFYRLITDFKYSKIKVWRSFIAVWYLLSGKVKVEVRE